MRYPSLAAAFLAISTPLWAEPLKVVTDIPPVHGLVSMVMKGVNDPEVLLQPNTSAHDFALRPSQAQQLAEADLVFWIGPSLSPQLEDAFDTLSGNADILAFDTSPVSATLAFRELEDFGEQDHEDHHDHDDHSKDEGHDGHDHDEHHDEHADHDEHAKHDDHSDHANHDDHADDHADKHDHGHDHDHDHAGGVDPHLWLDPENATAWLTVIADKLAEADPDNAATYRANAQTAATEISEISARIASQLSETPATGFLVSHDAFQYFETHFERYAVGAVSLSDAVSPSPRHLAELRERVVAADLGCVLIEPLTNTGLVNAASGDTALQVVEVDPMGFELALGASFYPMLLENMGQALTTCLTPDASN